jgi:hypothetical protein
LPNAELRGVSGGCGQRGTVWGKSEGIGDYLLDYQLLLSAKVEELFDVLGGDLEE